MALRDALGNEAPTNSPQQVQARGVPEAASDSREATISRDLTGVITDWDRGAQQLFGFSAEEMIGTSVLRLYPGYLRYQEAAIRDRVLNGETIQGMEAVRLNSAGREIAVSLEASAVLGDAGQVIGLRVVVRDISERQDLDLARLRLAAIVESADDAILSKDLNGFIMSWNRAAERIFGFTEEEMLCRSILRLIPPELHSEEALILGRIRQGDRVEHFESERLTKSGRRISVSLTVSPLRDEIGRIVGASKIARDITQRKLLEEKVAQGEKLAASGKMAATIAHEINNPLEAVLNLIYLAKITAAEPEVVEYLTSAESEVERLAHIAKQTLGFYREQNAAVRLSPATLLADALKIYDSKLRSAGIRVRTEFASMRPVVMRRGEMMQVVSNLITNASYAMTGGGVLSLKVEDCARGALEGLLITVEDTGVGIPQDNLRRVFEPFFTTRSSIGTGIGLWVARRFVEGHQGEILVESSTDPERHGTSFRIWLPLHTPYAPELADLEANGMAGPVH